MIHHKGRELSDPVVWSVPLKHLRLQRHFTRPVTRLQTPRPFGVNTQTGGDGAKWKGRLGCVHQSWQQKKKKRSRGEKFKRCSLAHLLCRYQRVCFWKVTEIVRRGVERCGGERGLVRMFTFRQKKKKTSGWDTEIETERERVSGSGTCSVFYSRETVMACLSYELPACLWLWHQI